MGKANPSSGTRRRQPPLQMANARSPIPRLAVATEKASRPKTESDSEDVHATEATLAEVIVWSSLPSAEISARLKNRLRSTCTYIM